MTNVEVKEISKAQSERTAHSMTPEKVERVRLFREAWERREAELGMFTKEAYAAAAADVDMSYTAASELMLEWGSWQGFRSSVN